MSQPSEGLSRTSRAAPIIHIIVNTLHGCLWWAGEAQNLEADGSSRHHVLLRKDEDVCREKHNTCPEQKRFPHLSHNVPPNPSRKRSPVPQYSLCLQLKQPPSISDTGQLTPSLSGNPRRGQARARVQEPSKQHTGRKRRRHKDRPSKRDSRAAIEAAGLPVCCTVSEAQSEKRGRRGWCSFRPSSLRWRGRCLLLIWVWWMDGYKLTRRDDGGQPERLL